jgi:predicted neuraminidase
MKRCSETHCQAGPRLLFSAIMENTLMRKLLMVVAALAAASAAPAGRAAQGADRPFLTSELIFPLEHWHNHSSMVVELPGGDLLACWFHGSGERQADDVIVQGARLRKGSKAWSAPFLLADTPGYPDTNATVFLDPKKRLWLMWPTILANEWHTALMKYKIASDYRGAGAPKWEANEVLHVTPGDEFAVTVNREIDRILASGPPTDQARAYAERQKKNAADKLYRRLGWMTRAHPYVLDGTRLIVPLYSDGFSFSLMAITDDWGATWKTSTPLVGRGNIQPSLARKKDGTLVAYMRDNGPAPKRLMVSRSTDRGETWSPVEDSDRPNPGAGAEVLVLQNGNWALIYNDLERGRYRLAVSLSDDEGQTWRWTRHLERDPDSTDEQQLGQYHYPSIIQAADGTLHATYSFFAPVASVKADADKRLPRKAIKHAHFNEAWVKQGASSQ